MKKGKVVEMELGSLDECLGCIYEESDHIRVHLEYCIDCKRAHYDPDIRNLFDDKFVPSFHSLRFDRSEPLFNCNKCKWINITVEDNNQLYKETRREINHICHYYNKRLLHRGKGRDGSIYLYPCTNCRRDGFINYYEGGKHENT